MIVSIGFHLSCGSKKSGKLIQSLYNIFIDLSRFFKILIRYLVDERYSDKPTLSSLNQNTSYKSVLHQILSDKMVKITKNTRYEYGKLKTGARHLNKWPNLRKKHSSFTFGHLFRCLATVLSFPYLNLLLLVIFTILSDRI